jgi:hypothetical protein
MQVLIHSEHVEGFDIHFYALPEEMHPRHHFDDSVDDISDICDKINRGVYQWFVAKVTASKAGIELSSDYLGGCLYDSCEQFVEDNDYYSDMRNSVIQQAKEKINELAEVTA